MIFAIIKTYKTNKVLLFPLLGTMPKYARQFPLLVLIQHLDWWCGLTSAVVTVLTQQRYVEHRMQISQSRRPQIQAVCYWSDSSNYLERPNKAIRQLSRTNMQW